MAPIGVTPNVAAIVKDIGQKSIPQMQNLLEELNKGSLKVTQASADKIKAAIGTRAGVLIASNPSIADQQILKLMMYEGEAAKAVSLEVNGSGVNCVYSSGGNALGVGTRLDIPAEWNFNPHNYAERYEHNSG